MALPKINNGPSIGQELQGLFQDLKVGLADVTARAAVEIINSEKASAKGIQQPLNTSVDQLDRLNNTVDAGLSLVAETVEDSLNKQQKNTDTSIYTEKATKQLTELNTNTDENLTIVSEVLADGIHESKETAKELYKDILLLRDSIVGGFDKLIQAEQDRWRVEDERNKRLDGIAAENAAEAERGKRGDGARVIMGEKDKEETGDVSNTVLNILSSPLKLIGLAIAAWATDLDKVIRAIKLPQTLKWLASLFVDIETMLKSVRQGFKVARLGEEFAHLRELVLGKTGFLGKIGAFFGDVTVKVGGILDSIMKPVQTFVSYIKEFRIFKVIAGSLDDLGRAFGPFIEGASKAFGFLKPLGSVFKFLAGPISLAIFGLLDFFKGFMKGFEEGGLLAGVKEGFMEVFRGFVTYPLDLVKDLLSWTAEKLGFDGISKMLDSFSFTEIFNKFIESPLDLIKDTLSWVASKFGFDQFADTLDSFSFKDLFADMGNAVTDAVKRFVANAMSFLPEWARPQWLKEWAASTGVTAKPSDEGPKPGTAASRSAPGATAAGIPSTQPSVAGPANAQSGPQVQAPTGKAASGVVSGAGGAGGNVSAGALPQVMGGQDAKGTRGTQGGPMVLPGGTLQAASALIKKEEGLPKNGKAYKDAHGISIGYGHFIKDNEYKQGFIQAGDEQVRIAANPIDTVITPGQAEKLLIQDLPRYEDAAKKPLGEAWGKLDDSQKATLISYAYNTGSTVSLVKAGLKDAVLSGNMQQAADIIRNKGIRTSGGTVLPVLVARRGREADIFASGKGAASGGTAATGGASGGESPVVMAAQQPVSPGGVGGAGGVGGVGGSAVASAIAPGDSGSPPQIATTSATAEGDLPVVEGAGSYGLKPTAIAAGEGSVQIAAAKESGGTSVSAPVIAPNNSRTTNVSTNNTVVSPNPRPDEPSYLMLTNALYSSMFG